MEKLAKLIYSGIILVLLYYIFPYFLPFILALVVAVIFDPLVVWLTKKTRVNRIVCVIFLHTTLFIGSIASLYKLFSLMVKEGIFYIKKIPETFETLIQNNQHFYDFYNGLSEQSQDYITKSSSTLVQKTTEFLSNSAGDVFLVVKNFPAYFVALIVFVIAVYLIALDLPNLKSRLFKFIPDYDSQRKVDIVLVKLNKAIVGFIQAQIILSTLTFLFVAVGFFMIGVENIIAVSLLTVFVDLLPILGTGMVLVPWGCYLIFTGSIGQGVGLVVLFVSVTFFRRVIEPKLIGNTIGLNPLITLISLYVGFVFMGMIGMILGPAICIILKALDEAGMIKLRIKI